MNFYYMLFVHKIAIRNRSLYALGLNCLIIESNLDHLKKTPQTFKGTLPLPLYALIFLSLYLFNLYLLNQADY